MRFHHLFVAALASCLSISGQTFAQSASNADTNAEQTEIDPLAYVLPEDKNKMFEIGWDDLLPPGEAERTAAQIQARMQYMFNVTEGGEGDVAVQFGSHKAVTILDGHKIRIPGYTVPFEFGKNAKIKEFLLVPYYGACLHAPPPPPNQTIYVKTDKPIKLKDLQQAVWIEGYIHIDSTYTDLAEAAYTVSLTDLEIYDN